MMTSYDLEILFLPVLLGLVIHFTSNVLLKHEMLLTYGEECQIYKTEKYWIFCIALIDWAMIYEVLINRYKI